MKKHNHEGHRARMRETFGENGFSGWQKHNVLEYLLFYSIPRGDTNDIAHDLIKHCGSFSNVFHVSKEQLKQVDNVGDKTAEYICMLGEFIKYYNRMRYDKKNFVLNSEASEGYLIELFDGESRECLYMICLDAQFNILNQQKVFDGSFESMDVDITTIIRTAVRCDAAYVVLAHNHPSGVAKASNADIVSTQATERALHISGVNLLDHIIVAGGKCVSMREEGYLN